MREFVAARTWKEKESYLSSLFGCIEASAQRNSVRSVRKFMSDALDHAVSSYGTYTNSFIPASDREQGGSYVDAHLASKCC